ncbi:MAG: ABC transporter permease [Deltaproteobacteria bacterium]|nr:ABC transporter permease [Deltaproteobacteria bacterium]
MKEAFLSPSRVFAVWLRHFHIYFRNWFLRIVAPVSEPVVYLVGFGYGMSPLVGDIVYLGKALPYTNYIAPGMISVAVLFQTFLEATYGTFVRIRFQKSWQTLLTGPMTFADIFVADLLWAATKGTVAGIVTSIVAVFFGAMSIAALFIAIPFIILGSLMFSAFGMIFAAHARIIDELNVPIFLFLVPMFAFSGTYFPRDNLPLTLRVIADMMPLAPLADLLRDLVVFSRIETVPLLITFLWTIAFTMAAWISHSRKLYK